MYPETLSDCMFVPKTAPRARGEFGVVAPSMLPPLDLWASNGSSTLLELFVRSGRTPERPQVAI